MRWLDGGEGCRASETTFPAGWRFAGLTLYLDGPTRFPHTNIGFSMSSQKTFVLIHGGWHGGWVWRDVLPRNVSTIVRQPGVEFKLGVPAFSAVD